jgi:hypothetical protein
MKNHRGIFIFGGGNKSLKPLFVSGSKGKVILI